MLKQIFVILLLLIGPTISNAQVKTFKQLNTLVNSDAPTMRKLLRFENYSYGYTKEFYEHLVCEVWLYKGNENSKNAYCMCKYYDEYPMYMYLDSTMNFLQNTLIEIDKMGYTHSDDSKYQYYEKGNKYLLIANTNGIYLYWLSNTKETLAMMYLLSSAKDK